MNYLAQAVMLAFKLCVQTGTADWDPLAAGREITLRQSEINAIIRTVEDDCTGLATTRRIYYVVGSYDVVRARISSDIR